VINGGHEVGDLCEESGFRKMKGCVIKREGREYHHAFPSHRLEAPMPRPHFIVRLLCGIVGVLWDGAGEW
jgi:hypothetical protein